MALVWMRLMVLMSMMSVSTFMTMTMILMMIPGHDTDDNTNDDTDDDTDDGGRGNRRPLLGGAVHFPAPLVPPPLFHPRQTHFGMCNQG